MRWGEVLAPVGGKKKGEREGEAITASEKVTLECSEVEESNVAEGKDDHGTGKLRETEELLKTVLRSTDWGGEKGGWRGCCLYDGSGAVWERVGPLFGFLVAGGEKGNGRGGG